MPWRISICCRSILLPLGSIQFSEAVGKIGILRDPAQRRPQIRKCGFAEVAREVAMRLLPIGAAAGHRFAARLCEANRPTPAVTRVASQDQEPVAFERRE